MYYVPFCLLVADLGWSHIGTDELRAFQIIIYRQISFIHFACINFSHAAASRVIGWDAQRSIPFRLEFVFHISTYLVYENVTTTPTRISQLLKWIQYSIWDDSSMHWQWQWRWRSLHDTYDIQLCHAFQHPEISKTCAAMSACGPIERRSYGASIFFGCKMILIVVILSC